MLRGSFSSYGLAKMAAGVAVAILWAGGCSDAHGPAAKLAAVCTINSDCDAPLVCAFQRCHTACESSRDCDPGQRCVASDRPFHVCQLEDESKCKTNSNCPEGQICGVDSQCRDACITSRDCIKGQVCVAATCADPDELSAQGTLQTTEADAGTGVSGLPCSFNSDCPSSLLCKGGICAPECRSTVDCSPGLACDNSRCVVPLACPLGDADKDPRAGGPCLYSSQCPAPLACVHGYCSCECLGASDCAPGFACVSNRCQAVASGAKAIEVGPGGGTVTSSDGKLSMNIPAGAIDGAIVFSVRAATAWPSGAVGQVYEVEPSGTQFAKPATIALSYAGLNIDAATAAKLFVGTAVGSSWQSLGTAVNDTKAQTVASSTTHLSVFGLVSFAAGADAGVDVGGNGGAANGGSAGNGGAGLSQAGNPGAGGIDNSGGRSGTTGGGGFPAGGTTGGGATGNGGFPAGGTTTSSGGRAGSGGVTQTSGGAGSGGFSSGGTTASGGFSQTGGFGPGGATTVATKDAGAGGLPP
jgi:hypothetical protein